MFPGGSPRKRKTLRRLCSAEGLQAHPRARVYAALLCHHWRTPSGIKRQFGNTVDFVGDNRVIFDLGGNKCRLIVHVSFTFGRLLVKFIGTHAEYDRIDPETVSWRKK
jgi:mRNA interferase HigB